MQRPREQDLVKIRTEQDMNERKRDFEIRRKKALKEAAELKMRLAAFGLYAVAVPWAALIGFYKLGQGKPNLLKFTAASFGAMYVLSEMYKPTPRGRGTKEYENVMMKMLTSKLEKSKSMYNY